MTILIVISLILHLFTFLWIITLSQKMNAMNANQTDANDFEKVKSEIEDILLSYTEQMKDENEKLLLQIKRENDLINQKLNSETVEKMEEPPMAAQTVQLDLNRKPEPKNKELDDDYSKYVPPSIPEESSEDVYEQSDTAKVLSLAKQGLDAEQIAKKLSLGKGEVELMLKFYQNES